MFFWKFWGIVLQYVLIDIRMDWCGIVGMIEVGGGSVVKILIQWMHSVDLIGVPETIADNIVEYQDDFLAYVDGVSFDDKMGGTCFGTENFIDYLNNYILEHQSEKAYIIREDYTPTTPRQIKEQKKLKKLYF